MNEQAATAPKNVIFVLAETAVGNIHAIHIQKRFQKNMFSNNVRSQSKEKQNYKYIKCVGFNTI